MELLVGALVAVVVALATAVGWQRRELADLASRASADVDGPTDVITVQLRDHGAAARTRTRLAGPLHAVAPGLVRSLVHREVVRELRTELQSRGIDAEVRVRRLEPRAPARKQPVERAAVTDEPRRTADLTPSNGNASRAGATVDDAATSPVAPGGAAQPDDRPDER